MSGRQVSIALELFPTTVGDVVRASQDVELI